MLIFDWLMPFNNVLNTPPHHWLQCRDGAYNLGLLVTRHLVRRVEGVGGQGDRLGSRIRSCGAAGGAGRLFDSPDARRFLMVRSWSVRTTYRVNACRYYLRKACQRGSKGHCINDTCIQ